MSAPLITGKAVGGIVAAVIGLCIAVRPMWISAPSLQAYLAVVARGWAWALPFLALGAFLVARLEPADRAPTTKRAIAGTVLGLIGFCIAATPMWPSPAASVQAHVSVVARAEGLALLALAAGAVLLGHRGRCRLVRVALAVLLWVFLWHPVADLIPDSEVPGVESQGRTLLQRSMLGEGFRWMDGHWYQVKPSLLRVFF